MVYDGTALKAITPLNGPLRRLEIITVSLVLIIITLLLIHHEHDHHSHGHDHHEHDHHSHGHDHYHLLLNWFLELARQQTDLL